MVGTQFPSEDLIIASPAAPNPLAEAFGFARRPVREFATAEELVAKLKACVGASDQYSRTPTLYQSNLGPVIDLNPEIVIQVNDRLGIRCWRGEISKTAEWNVTWNDTFGTRQMLFAPEVNRAEILGVNINHWGREMSGAPSDPFFRIQSHKGAFWAVISDPDDYKFYPALTLQSADIVGAFGTESWSEEHIAKNSLSRLPYASFGVVLSLRDNRGGDITIDRKVFAYTDCTLLAERQITHGIVTDCDAIHWEDKLVELKSAVSADILEAGIPDFRLTDIRYSTYPKELGILIGIGDDGSRSVSVGELYDNFESVLKRNSRF